MIWGLIGVIIVSLAYVVSVIMKYTAAQSQSYAKINALEKKSANLERAVEHERKINSEKMDQVRVLKGLESDLKQEVALVQQQLKTAQIQESSLEMDMYKQEFKKSKQRSY